MGVLKVLFLDDIPDDCTCAVCHEVLENPREFSRCQHAFYSCPTCRAPVTSSDLRHLHRIWREKLYQLLMRCEFHDAGCDVTMPFKKGTRSVACQDSNPRPLDSESHTLPLRHTTPHTLVWGP
ncbi:hypothetical protein Bbelb_197600 [Branchiostoma belcheri]|nr:hypothetical protein Bbelb_197600 [Branchiostoma belcheri]